MMPTLGSERGTIEVYWFRTDLPPVEVERLAPLLSEAERARSERFRFARDRARYVAGRGQLRAVLARHAGAPPGHLQFSLGPWGKPALLPAPGGRALEFNLSHSDGIGVVAVSHGGELGVDIERVRPIPDATAIAERLFTSEQQRRLLALPDPDRPAAFFRLWTRGEALLKSLGCGLASAPVLRALPPGGTGATRVELDFNGTKTVRWLQALPEVCPGFVAALAASGPTTVCCEYWPGPQVVP